MPEYKAPVKEMKFIICDVVGIDELTALDMYQDASDDIIDAILNEGAKFAGDILSPTNVAGDQHPATISNGMVTTSPGFKEAYQAYTESGWGGISSNPEYGGQRVATYIGTFCE